MAKVRVVNNNLDANLNGDNFENTASQTIFKFGSFRVTSNFDGRNVIDYSKELSTFVRPITLETLNLTDTQSDQNVLKTKNVVLNLDRSDLNTFVKFGSAREFIRVSIENIITKFPGSLFVNSQKQRGKTTTIFDYSYNTINNITKFKVPSPVTENSFGLVYDVGNDSKPNDNDLKNLNLSFNKYVVWSQDNPNNNSFVVVGFTGDTVGKPYLNVECIGNPFPSISGGSTSARIDYHLKPNTIEFDDFRISLNEYEKHIVSSREGIKGFVFNLKDPTLLDNGNIKYSSRNLLWNTSDGYNIDINTPAYRKFLENVLAIGNKYDQIKTDLIARFLSPTSLKTYDLTENKKIPKLLKIYGAEFDKLKQFIDSLVYINKITYDKKNNLPDQIVSNLARTMGWEYFQLIKEDEFVDNILNNVEGERNLNNDLTPAEVDIEMWRRILLNTNYFWKSKGTRKVIKSIFTLIGIPEPFINITEYIYTVNGPIDPRNVELSLDDLPSASLPYDNEGYPKTPIETDDFYFQVSGNSDNGQAYMNNFRNVGFDLLAQVDNKKSWYKKDNVYRRHHSTPTYYEQNDRLILNTKEVNISLDTSRGIEYDVWRYTKEIDFPANSTGFTLPFTFVNLSLDVSNPTQNEFTLPDEPEGDVEVRFNGILLLGPNTWDGSGVTSGNTVVDYYFTSNKTFKLGSSVYGDIDAQNNSTRRDVIEATYVYREGSGLSQVTIKYIVATITPSLLSATIPLPDKPDGDIQLTINGVAATKGTSQFIADYVVNDDKIIIQNPTLLSYFQTNPYVQVAYVTVSGSSNINARQEITRVDSLVSGKIFYNNNANRTVYRLNYKIKDESGVKILVDGIALEPRTDYYVNPNNQYELYLPPNINLGSVVSAYYLVGGEALSPLVDGSFGVGDISDLSFLEFIELIQRRMINASNRKVITDHKGGWYPTLLKLYNTYLKRYNLNDQDPLKSNGYAFNNLYPFLNKYNAFFQRFVDKLLNTTIIQKESGLLVRNTMFTKQKFTYKRGVNFDNDLNYFGDDGSVFFKRPNFQNADWTDDIVQVDDLCEDFEINNIHIQYPTTTTTTTQTPFNTVLYYNNIFTLVSPFTDFGQESTERYRLDFSPEMIPGYSITLRLDFLAEYLIETTDVSNGGTVIAEVEVKKNNVIVFGHDKQINTNSMTTITELFNVNYDVTINSGDVVIITLYNLAINNTLSNAKILSSTNLSSTALNVTPNGSVSSYVPNSVENIASKFI